MAFSSWLLLMAVALSILEQCSSSSLCDSSVERGIISTSSGTVLVDTSLPVDPVCIRCGYQDQLYTDTAIVTYYYNGAVIVNDTIGGVWVTDEGLIIQDPAMYFDHIICSFVPVNESMARSDEIDIILFASAKVLSFTPDSSTVVVGNTLTLNCTFEGDPLPHSVLWSHNMTILNVSTDPNLSETLLESYALLDVTFADINDTGVYMCLVNNSFSFDQSNPSVFIVQVAPSPVFKFQNNDNMTTEVCITLSWVFGFNGNAPIIGVDIFYNATRNNFAPQSNTIHTASPTQASIGICDLQPRTTYEFTIRVRNEISDKVGVSDPVNLSSATLSSKPDAPRLIVVEAISTEELIVNWTSNFSSYTQDPIIGYEIYYNKLRNESKIMTFNVTDGLATSQVLSGLEHGTVYEITIVSINSAGYSPESDTLRQRTKDNKGNLFSENILEISIAGGALLVLLCLVVTITTLLYKHKRRTISFHVQQLATESSNDISSSYRQYEVNNREDTDSLDNIEFEKVDFDEGGLVHHSSVHGATIVIPEGAVEGQASVQIGATLLFSNFKCEGSFNPVSPFIWIHTDSELLKPAKLYIPHYIDTETSSNTKLFLLAKGHEENAVFKVIEDANVELFETVGCVDMRHFCVVCLAAAENGNPPKVRYHALVVEKEDVTRFGKEIHLCLLYTLNCLKKLRAYYIEQGYNVVDLVILKGGISDDGVTFCTDLSDSEDWKVTQIGKKQRSIKTSDIEIFEVLGCTSNTVTAETKEDLKFYEQAGTYPPRFKLRFFSESNKFRQVTVMLQGLPEGECSFNIMLGEEHSLVYSRATSDQPSEGDGLIFDLLPYLEGALVDLATCFKFGNSLGIPIPELHEIESSAGHDLKIYIIKMLRIYWKMELHGSFYNGVSETLQKIRYPVLSAIITKRFSHETQNAGDDYCLIEGPRIVEAQPNSNIGSLGIEIIQKLLSSLPNGSQVWCSEPTLPDLLNLVVANLPSKWMDFGIQVNIGRPNLDAIEKDQLAKCKDCFSQTISTWKNMKSAPFTWETVLTVLYSPVMKEYRAAEQVYSHLKLMSDVDGKSS